MRVYDTTSDDDTTLCVKINEKCSDIYFYSFFLIFEIPALLTYNNKEIKITKMNLNFPIQNLSFFHFVNIWDIQTRDLGRELHIKAWFFTQT